VRAAAVQQEKETAIAVALPGRVVKVWRKYEYHVAAPPKTEDGDLPGPVGKVKALRDKVKPLSLTICTTAYEDAPPPAVTELKAERFQDTRIPGAFAWAQRVTWKASAADDVVYYRVFHGDERAGSTAATEFVDEDSHRKQGVKWRVVAVDSPGNAGPAMECERGQ
jgi:hypothetical protein